MRNHLLSIRNISIISSRLLLEKERGPRGVLDPKYNKVFLNVFGTDRNKLIAMKFITDITGLPIEDITYINRYADSDNDDQAESIVDVRCKTSSGEQFLIEI